MIASARIKHDKLDSRVLARLLHAGFIAEAWIAPRPVRELRQLVRFRTRTVRWATRAKNGVHGVLNRQGMSSPVESRFGPKGRAFLEEVKLKELDRWEVDDQLQRLDLLEQEIRDLDQEIRQRGQASAVARAQKDPFCKALQHTPSLYMGLLRGGATVKKTLTPPPPS